MRKLLRMQIYLREDSSAVNEQGDNGYVSCADFKFKQEAIIYAIQTLQDQLKVLENEALTSSHL